MGKRGNFVKPETKQLAVSEDEWIEAKLRLTKGEQLRLSTSALGNMLSGRGDGTIEVAINWSKFNIERFVVWIIDWLVFDDDNKPVKFTRQAVENLDPDVFDKIDAVLTAHIAEGEETKKARGGGLPTATAS